MKFAFANAALAFSAVEAQDSRYDCPETSCWCQDTFSAEEVVVTSGVEFSTVLNHYTGEKQTLYLDMYAPPVIAEGARLPGAVVIHGGGYSTGGHNGCSHGRDMGWFVDRAKAFAQRGFVTVSIDYRCEGPTWRTDPLSWWRDPVTDARSAIEYLHGLSFVDPQRITAFGGSAGAITVADLVYTPLSANETGTELSCGIGLSGAIVPTAMEAGNITADASNPPYMDFHGTNDTTVPWDHSPSSKRWWSAIETKSWLDDKHAPNDLVAMPGEGHVPFKLLYQDPYVSTFFGFLLEKMELSALACPVAPSPVPSVVV